VSAAPLRATRMMRISVFLVCVVAVAAVACVQDRADPPFIVRDSAGVQIVENTGPGTGAADAWRVPEGAAVSLGVLQGDEAQQFSMIGGATRFSDGRIAVLEQLTAELRFFDSAGVHLSTVGGFGEGPGEFRHARALVRLAGDTLAVWDVRDQSINLFSSAGGFLSKKRLYDPALFRGVEWSWSCSSRLPTLSTGAILRCAVEPGITEGPAEAASQGLHRRAIRLVAVPRSLGHLDTLGVYLGPEHYVLALGGGGIVDGAPPFPSETHVAVGLHPSRFYVAANPEYSIEVWDPEGTLVRRLGRRNARRRPTADEIRQGWERALANVSDDLKPRVRAISPVPDLLPAIRGLAAGPDGELWVKRGPVFTGRGRAVFDVFDPSGRYLGEVTTPYDIDLQEVGRDYLLGTRTDDQDVPYVDVFLLDRGR